MREKYYWANKYSRRFLSKDYLDEGVTVEQRIRQIADRAEEILGIEGFSDKFENYAALGYYTLATPVLINFGNDKGFPVSCFGTYMPDDTIGILRSVAEIGVMSKMGGGTSAYFGDLRPRGSAIKNGRGGVTDGPIPFMGLVQGTTDVISQGASRRGSSAVYMDVTHPDFPDMLQFRSEGNNIQTLSFGACISREWMSEMKAGDKAKRKLWGDIIKCRFKTGYPYILFTDNINDQAPQVYKDKGLKIRASNLCSEICLSSDEENSFVCVLSCLNLVHWDEIKETDAIETLIYFLDAVNEEFIQKADGIPYMERAVNFAKTQRALGAGVFGWHHFLQSKNIAFESLEARMLNIEIFSTFRERADKATQELAVLYGEPELLKGYGRRNVTTMANPPTTSSAAYMGFTSQSVEPETAVAYIKRLAKGVYEVRNPYFSELLDKLGKNTDEVWQSILLHGGTVDHLDFLTQHQKEVYNTFAGISQKEIIIQQADRQPYQDQTTSLNLAIPHNAKPKDVSDLLILAEENGVKSVYYQISTSPTQGVVRDIVSCKSCEG